MESSLKEILITQQKNDIKNLEASIVLIQIKILKKLNSNNIITFIISINITSKNFNRS